MSEPIFCQDLFVYEDIRIFLDENIWFLVFRTLQICRPILVKMFFGSLDVAFHIPFSSLFPVEGSVQCEAHKDGVGVLILAEEHEGFPSVLKSELVLVLREVD